MLLGYNTNGLQNHRLEDGLRLLADRGFRAVALTLDVQHLDPLHCSSREVERVATLLSELALHPVIETGARFVLDPNSKHEPTLMTRDVAGRSRRIEFYARCAEIGRDLGAGVLSFWSGVDRQPGEDARAWLAEGVALTCEAIANRGLMPALEPEPGMQIGTVAEYEGLLADLDGTALALCLDIGHLYVTGEAEPDAVISAHKERLVQVHLEDIRRGVHEHLPPGDGDVDFVGVRVALERHGYDGPVCFELSRSSHMAPEAIERCVSTWDAAAR